MEAEVLPVETHATRFRPRRTACATPHVIPLSLNDPVGLKPWGLKVRWSTPQYPAARGALKSGLLPWRSEVTAYGTVAHALVRAVSSLVSTPWSSNGNNSLYRQPPLCSNISFEVRRSRHVFFHCC